MKLGFASDHRGFNLKQKLIKHFQKKGYDIIDCGTNNEDSCDYADYAYILGNKIKSHDVDYGIAICGSGIGISIALNKIKGIYCAKISNADEALHTRLDNDTNCIAFGEKTNLDDAIIMVNTFITTEYSNLERHNRRINKVKAIEEGSYRA